MKSLFDGTIYSFVMRGSLLFCGGLAGFSIVLGFCDRKIAKRLEKEIEYLKSIETDAATQLQTASDDHFVMVNHSEREIFQKVVNETDWCISQRESYPDRIPLLRAFLPPSDARATMSYALWMIAIEDDGDFYDNYLEFIKRV